MRIFLLFFTLVSNGNTLNKNRAPANIELVTVSAPGEPSVSYKLCESAHPEDPGECKKWVNNNMSSKNSPEMVTHICKESVPMDRQVICFKTAAIYIRADQLFRDRLLGCASRPSNQLKVNCFSTLFKDYSTSTPVQYAAETGASVKP